MKGSVVRAIRAFFGIGTALGFGLGKDIEIPKAARPIRHSRITGIAKAQRAATKRRNVRARAAK